MPAFGARSRVCTRTSLQRMAWGQGFKMARFLSPGFSFPTRDALSLSHSRSRPAATIQTSASVSPFPCLLAIQSTEPPRKRARHLIDPSSVSYKALMYFYRPPDFAVSPFTPSTASSALRSLLCARPSTPCLEICRSLNPPLIYSYFFWEAVSIGLFLFYLTRSTRCLQILSF